MSGASSVGFEARARKQRRTLARTVTEHKALKLDRKLLFAFGLRRRAEAWHRLKPGISLPQPADFTRRDLHHVAYRTVKLGGAAPAAINVTANRRAATVGQSEPKK
jgi:hypothetical protein